MTTSNVMHRAHEMHMKIGFSVSPDKIQTSKKIQTKKSAADVKTAR